MWSFFQGLCIEATDGVGWVVGTGRLSLLKADRILAKIRIFFFGLRILKAFWAITVPLAADLPLIIEAKDASHS